MFLRFFIGLSLLSPSAFAAVILTGEEASVVAAGMTNSIASGGAIYGKYTLPKSPDAITGGLAKEIDRFTDKSLVAPSVCEGPAGKIRCALYMGNYKGVNVECVHSSTDHGVSYQLAYCKAEDKIVVDASCFYVSRLREDGVIERTLTKCEIPEEKIN